MLAVFACLEKSVDHWISPQQDLKQNRHNLHLNRVSGVDCPVISSLRTAISKQINNGKIVLHQTASSKHTRTHTRARPYIHALHTCSIEHFCINFGSVNIWDVYYLMCMCVCVTVIKYSVIRFCCCLIGKIHFMHDPIERTNHRWLNFPRNHIPILLTIKLIAFDFDFDFEYLIIGPIFFSRARLVDSKLTLKNN